MLGSWRVCGAAAGAHLGGKAGDPVVVLQLSNGGPLLLVLHQALQHQPMVVWHEQWMKGKDEGQTKGR